MSKAKMEAARELIQEKKYDEARSLLRTVNHPLAAEWLQKIDDIKRSQIPQPKVTTRRASILLPAIAAIILVVVIIGVALYTQRARIPAVAALFASPMPLPTLVPSATSTPTSTPTPLDTSTPLPTETPVATKTPEICQYNQAEKDLISQFLDTATIAASTSRIAVSQLIVEMQKDYRSFDKLNPASCLGPATKHISSGMDFTVTSFLDFSAQKDDVIVGVDINLAQKEFKAADDECHKAHAIDCDYRLGNAKLFVWGWTS